MKSDNPWLGQGFDPDGRPARRVLTRKDALRLSWFYEEKARAGDVQAIHVMSLCWQLMDTLDTCNVLFEHLASLEPPREESDE